MVKSETAKSTTVTCSTAQVQSGEQKKHNRVQGQTETHTCEINAHRYSWRSAGPEHETRKSVRATRRDAASTMKTKPKSAAKSTPNSSLTTATAMTDEATRDARDD